ncbi:hypothetical protein D9M72_651880 [compost metagenome]
MNSNRDHGINVTLSTLGLRTANATPRVAAAAAAGIQMATPDTSAGNSNNRTTALTSSRTLSVVALDEIPWAGRVESRA